MKSNKFITAIVSVFCATASIFAQTWTQTSAPINYWASVASSADGTKLIAVGDFSVYLSTNSGVSWSSNSLDNFTVLKCAASSADGNTLITGGGGGLYVSTNAGAAWTQAPPTNFWISVAASADGTKFVAASLGDGHGGLIYTSTNSGVTWVTNDVPTNMWTAVASSADGTKLVAVAGGLPDADGFASGPIITSTNSGITWTPTTAGSNYWTSVACSADGTKLVAGSAYSTFFSTNSGLTWTWSDSPVSSAGAVASSADGTKLVLAALELSLGGEPVYTSSDSGNSWTSNSIPYEFGQYSATEWVLASSADGSKLIAALMIDAGVFTSYSNPAPQLDLASSNGCLALSWTIPSTNFVLQQNADLATTNWCNVTNVPALNFANLQYQVTLPAPAGNAFFRLKTP